MARDAILFQNNLCAKEERWLHKTGNGQRKRILCVFAGAMVHKSTVKAGVPYMVYAGELITLPYLFLALDIFFINININIINCIFSDMNKISKS